MDTKYVRTLKRVIMEKKENHSLKNLTHTQHTPTTITNISLDLRLLLLLSSLPWLHDFCCRFLVAHWVVLNLLDIYI